MRLFELKQLMNEKKTSLTAIYQSYQTQQNASDGSGLFSTIKKMVSQVVRLSSSRSKVTPSEPFDPNFDPDKEASEKVRTIELLANMMLEVMSRQDSHKVMSRQDSHTWDDQKWRQYRIEVLRKYPDYADKMDLLIRQVRRGALQNADGMSCRPFLRIKPETWGNKVTSKIANGFFFFLSCGKPQDGSLRQQEKKILNTLLEQACTSPMQVGGSDGPSSGGGSDGWQQYREWVARRQKPVEDPSAVVMRFSFLTAKTSITKACNSAVKRVSSVFSNPDMRSPTERNQSAPVVSGSSPPSSGSHTGSLPVRNPDHSPPQVSHDVTTNERQVEPNLVANIEDVFNQVHEPFWWLGSILNQIKVVNENMITDETGTGTGTITIRFLTEHEKQLLTHLIGSSNQLSQVELQQQWTDIGGAGDCPALDRLLIWLDKCITSLRDEASSKTGSTSVMTVKELANEGDYRTVTTVASPNLEYLRRVRHLYSESEEVVV